MDERRLRNQEIARFDVGRTLPSREFCAIFRLYALDLAVL